MENEVLRAVCLLINVGVLIVWFAFFSLAHNVMFKMHRQLFHFSVETFDAIHYAGMATYKIGIILLNLVPYVAIRLSQ